MGYDPRAIANFILDYAETKSKPLSNLSLQKLLYFCHAWYLAKYHRPLIDEAVEAWGHGPVYRSAYRCFRQAQRNPISFRATKLDFASGKTIIVEECIRDSDKEFIKNIFDLYANFTARQLRELSHEEGGPWHRIWQASKNKPIPGMKIPDSLIERYFSRSSHGMTKH